MAVFPVEDDICEKKASDFLWETLYIMLTYPSVIVSRPNPSFKRIVPFYVIYNLSEDDTF